MGEPTLLWHYGRITMPDITGTLVNSSIRFVKKPGPFLGGGGGAYPRTKSLNEPISCSEKLQKKSSNAASQLLKGVAGRATEEYLIIGLLLAHPQQISRSISRQH